MLIAFTLRSSSLHFPHGIDHLLIHISRIFLLPINRCNLKPRSSCRHSGSQIQCKCTDKFRIIHCQLMSACLLFLDFILFFRHQNQGRCHNPQYKDSHTSHIFCIMPGYCFSFNFIRKHHIPGFTVCLICFLHFLFQLSLKLPGIIQLWRKHSCRKLMLCLCISVCE